MTKDDRRAAERHAPPKPVPATFGGFAARIIDISLIGCRIEHTDRLTPRARLPLRFLWRREKIQIDARVVRSELTSVGGRPAYISGLGFCDSADASPPVIREIVDWLIAAAKKNEPPPAQVAVAAEAEEEPELLSAKYLRCTLSNDQWSKCFVDDPAQPDDGFTIRAPADDREADVLCRAYAQADPAKRGSMRASFQRDIARNGGVTS